MSVELKVPEIGESITEVVIGEWLKAEGDPVKRDEDVLVIESDKATVEIPAPASGRLVKILKQNGDTATVGEVIGRLEAEEPKATESKGASSQEEKAQKHQEEETRDKETKEAENAEPEAAGTELKERAIEEKSVELRNREGTKEKENTNETEVEQEAAESIEEKREDTEKQKEEADQAGTKRGKKPETRATTKDKEEKARKTETDEGVAKESDEAPPLKIISTKRASDDRTPVGPEQKEPEEEKPVQGPQRRSARREETVPMTPIRQRIAERLVQAQQRTAFLTTFNEIDMSAVSAIRQQYQDDFRRKYSIKLGFMSFFVKASIEALKLIPQVNAEIRGTDIVYRSYYDIGVAVGSGRGLVVPVLRNAESMSFAEVEQAIDDFARRAEKRQLKPDELEGGTFTISNGGIYGSLLSTPIINGSQSGILGMHAIQDRPVVRDGQIVIRSMMYVALTYDHRIVDGREAVTFLKRIKECVEGPSRILLEA